MRGEGGGVGRVNLHLQGKTKEKIHQSREEKGGRKKKKQTCTHREAQCTRKHVAEGKTGERRTVKEAGTTRTAGLRNRRAKINHETR